MILSTNNVMAANSSVPVTGESYTRSKGVYKTQLKQSKKRDGLGLGG